MTSSVIKHFTASGLISDNRGHFLLHLHPKLGIWLPPGGHIEENEEPQDAVLREIHEETGLDCRVISWDTQAQQHITPLPEVDVLPLPMAILKEFIRDKKTGEHRHIDMVYWCRPLREDVAVHPEFHWLTPDEISTLDNVPQDVCGLIAMIQSRL
ncbi:NUDIX hydrolase [Morganella psychrotolerans]|uniref:DNA mismatch repair protein MutT n=1 Tax=Morganella psychrotolerans TaxID=368603 RepID=A0A1B8HPD9_9GAMM|nr:NUDIX domain-containing protein [Morganella psychrotolerans]OBU11242.1 DNA mismatch repair protein MutT [Morganella psychrotolerans]